MTNSNVIAIHASAAPCQWKESAFQECGKTRLHHIWQDGAAPHIPEAAQLCHQVEQSKKGEDTRWEYELLAPVTVQSPWH